MIRLGFSIIVFAIMYGIAFVFMPIITGTVFSNLNPTLVHSNSDWLSIYNTHEDTVKYLVPLIPSIAIFIFVLKVMMNASSRGRE